jgi:hypothetical protein
MGQYLGYLRIIPWDNISGWWCNNHLEKYEKVNWDMYIYIYGKIKAMFQTTNQRSFVALG